MIDLSPRRAVLGPLLGLAVTGLALAPSSSQAAGSHHGAVAHHAKRKKGKKKGGTQVIVHCASLGVTCKGTPGPTGPQGPAGAAGAPGANGANVVLRARGSGVATLTTASSSCGEIFCGESIPVSPNTWVEGPEEDDQLIGSVTITIPGKAACGYENSSKELQEDQVILDVQVDGKLEGITEIEGSTGGITVNAPIVFDLGLEGAQAAEEGFGTGFFMGSGTSQNHSLIVQGADKCETAVHATVSNLAIDVLGTS